VGGHFGLVHLYNSKVFTGAEKENPAVSAGKVLVSFFRQLGENRKIEAKILVEPEVSSLYRPIFTILADSVCGIIWKAEAFQKSRAQKNERRRGGWGRRATLRAERSEAS